MLDYKATPLTARGREIDSFCVSGFAAEAALKKSLSVGCSALSARHLPDAVPIAVDGRGKRDVKLYDENRDLAVQVVKVVRAKLHTHGLAVKQAVVPVRDSVGRLLGEHDGILEIVTDGRGGPPDENTPDGFISLELRMRRLWSESGRQQVRADLRLECCDECRLVVSKLNVGTLGVGSGGALGGPGGGFSALW